ncbi:Pr6Pr family membrane protein [Spiroplasma melliferum]|uniref:Pr6Pr family membrane protein n=1 Tax=Spiroplasma melliferum TaxID=2134 RepID=UPI0002A6517B|nr:Pr6Pr family membrane protein [Spiroplasma melliferum]ELL44963.1 hypothetical protein SMIPMB4A_v3c0970 [Spiroplasma melliferum IPMB4A]
MILKIKLAWKQIYKLFFAIVGLVILGWAFINGILNQNDIINHYNGDYTVYTLDFFTTFTCLSNLGILFWFLISGIRHHQENKNKIQSYPVALAAACYITITFIIYNCLLLPTQPLPGSPIGWITTVIDHMTNPIAFVIYILFFMENKQEINLKQFFRKNFWKYLLVLLGYCAYAMIRGELRRLSGNHFTWPGNEPGIIENRWYPYFFLNIHTPFLGIPGYVWFFIAFFAILGILIGSMYLYNYCNNKIIKTKFYQTLQEITINKNYHNKNYYDDEL